MPIRNSLPVSFIPLGLTDAVDQESAFPGACQSMSNCIFDRQNRGAVVARPGVTLKTSFGTFTSPGVISVALAVGTKIYGMIASGLNSGFDQPFVYDTSTSAFVTVSGITGANVPTTPSSTGAWVPPTMDVIGTKVVVTHPGFSGSNFFGWFDISTPSSPAWSAGNTSTNALPSVPLWVAQFFGRAYFGVKNAVYFSDSLAATAISNTNFAAVLTLGDTSNTMCAGGLPLSTTSSGVFQSLVVFKENSIYQISGDITGTGSNALALNNISGNVGCGMPRTVQSSPYGVLFIATDGPRLVNLAGEIQYLKRSDSSIQDIVSPFTNATTPTRACALYNNGVYRVCLDTVVKGNTYLAADYWYDLLYERWNGIHSFPYHGGVAIGSVFYLISNTFPAKLFRSEVVQTATSVYVDNSVAYNSGFQSASMPTSINPMAESAIVESTVELGKNTASSSYTLIAYDDLGNILNQIAIQFSTPTSNWGSVTWGFFVWQSSVTSNHVLTIPWTVPLVFKKIIILISSTASAGFSVREFSFRYQRLGYTNA